MPTNAIQSTESAALQTTTQQQSNSTQGQRPGRSPWDITVRSLGHTSTSTFRLKGLGCSCCFLANSPVLLADGTTKPIELFKGGEVVRTLTGTAVVSKLEVAHLGSTRKIIELGDGEVEPLFATDDHPLWSKVDGEEWWGTYNFSHYLFEKESGAGSFLKRDAIQLDRDRHQLHAHVTGWRKIRVIEHEMHDQTPVFHLALEGDGSYIVSGFVVISHCRDEYVAGVQWNGLQTLTESA